jgi:hypothetical protein
MAGGMIAVLALLMGGSPGLARAGEGAPNTATASPITITLSFKMDPRLSGPTYGGERWVSPPTYTGAAAQDTVEARAQAIDANGRPSDASFRWTPADPQMLSVSPGQGDRVKIAVKHAGESKLKVVAQGSSRELLVKAKSLGKTIQVEIVQLGERPLAGPPRAKDATAPKTHAVPGLAGPKERLSYALGMNLGAAARRQALEVDPALVDRGMRDVLAGGETLLSGEEARATLLEVRKEMKSAQSALQREKRTPKRARRGGNAAAGAMGTGDVAQPGHRRSRRTAGRPSSNAHRARVLILKRSTPEKVSKGSS